MSDELSQDEPIEYFEEYVKRKAEELIECGFAAGSGYPEVWIRDTNTFLRLALDHGNVSEIRSNLTVFFGFQQDDGSIIDGFLPKNKAVPPYYESIYFPQYAGFKNTVEIDQETSLVQAVQEYIRVTGDRNFLNVKFGEFDIGNRLVKCMNYLLNHKFNENFGLLFSATRADWGDVQPESNPGVLINNHTHFSISIYDNAMFLIAIDSLLEISPSNINKTYWKQVSETIKENCRKHLWDDENKKFIPHLYLKGSPFPSTFDENQIYYHGGTSVAILAGILSKTEILQSYSKMKDDVKNVGGECTIGLTMYPAYPTGFFKNKELSAYSYQNGGDWTWFGARMVQGLVINGFLEEAEEALLPMLRRVWIFGDFYEWYFAFDNSPRGSSRYKGSAGVLYQAILLLEKKRRGV